MIQKSGPEKQPAEDAIRDIRRATRRHFSAEEKIRIVLEGLRGEKSIAELCRREGIASSMYYGWSKEFLEAGKRRLAGDRARAATSDEVKDLRREAQALKEVVADLTLENRFRPPGGNDAPAHRHQLALAVRAKADHVHGHGRRDVVVRLQVARRSEDAQKLKHLGPCLTLSEPSAHIACCGTVRLTIKARPRSYTAAMPTARALSTSAIAFLRRSSAMRFGSISGFP